jgi:hypothetical protein
MATTASITPQRRGLTPAEAAALADRSRHRILSVIMVLLGLASLWFFALTVPAPSAEPKCFPENNPALAQTTTLSCFGLNQGGATAALQRRSRPHSRPSSCWWCEPWRWALLVARFRPLVHRCHLVILFFIFASTWAVTTRFWRGC